MLHSSSNRATPTGETITKLVRQHYKPEPKRVYSHEKVQCRTDVTCQKSKPDDYWTTNYRRRQANMQRGFYSSSKEPYKPIGGQLILDPCELVLSAVPGTVDKKINTRTRRRGTIYEEQKIETKPSGKEKTDDGSDSFTSLDLVDNAPTGGYDDIKKLLKESNQRIICLRAGSWYEDHVKTVEEASNAEMEVSKPEDTGMVLKSVSSVCLSAQAKKSSKQASSEPESGKSSRKSSGRVSIEEVIRTPSPVRRDSGSGRSTLKAPPIKKNKISLLQVSTGITSVLQRKERQFRDYLLFLKSMFSCLTALHNLKGRDIRSKVPLSREVVEKLQKEHGRDEDQSRGTYVSRGQGKHRGAQSFRSGYSSRRTTIAEASSELGDFLLDDLTQKRRSQYRSKINPGMQSVHRGRRLSSVSYNLGGQSSRRTSVADDFSDFGDFGQDAVSPRKQAPYLPSLLKSRNVATISSERPPLETWEDLLNYQPEPYVEKEGKSGGMVFQIGVITKFMRWYRRASIIPQHGAVPPHIDKVQLSHLQDIHEKGLAPDKSEKGERESSYGQQPPGSAVQNTEKVRKLVIWQQVAQEKSTVFQNSTENAPNADTTVQRCRRNLNKLKRSVQKENTATLEKIVRERVANFRLKLSTLNQEECSPLLYEQKLKLQDIKDNVNKSHLENFDVQPSKWYEELKEKTINMISSYNQPDIMDMLTKLQTYAHMDNKTLSYGKAKLCLLMMSLPAYDICQIYMQKALKFIFENIMLGQEAQFYEWLNHRKIPYMIVSDDRSQSGTPQRDIDSPTKDKS